jgi:hypothetical protein
VWTGYRPSANARIRPSDEKRGKLPVCASVISSWPVSTFQSFAALPVTVASVRPSGENATPKTAVVWLVKSAFSLPPGTCQSFAVLSLLALAKTLPSGEKAISWMEP